MRILSVNAWGGQLHTQLLPFLAGSRADVICLQEVLRSAGESTDWLLYRDGPVELQQRPNLFEEIAAVLPDHDGSFFPTSHGTLIGKDGPVWIEFGIACYVRKSLALIGQSVGFVHGAFSPSEFGDHPRPRNAHCLRVFDYDAGHAVTVAHLHGLRTTNGKADSPERDAQAAALAKIIQSVWPTDERLVVCGDLNVLPDSRLFQVLGQFGLSDLVTSRGFTGTRTSLYTQSERYADYMLVTPDVRVLDFDVVRDPEVSDHCPLLLDMA